MSRIGLAFNRLIAVESQTMERLRIEPAEPGPDAGARWGRRATFDILSRPRASEQPAQFVHEWVDQARRFKGVESHREYVRAVAVVDGTTLEPEAIRSVTFFLGSREVRHERREVEGGVTSVTPVIETISSYVQVAFPFGDADGSRGEPHPPETPPRQGPDFG